MGHEPQFVILCLTAGFHYDHLGGRNALAGWTDLLAVPIAPIHLFAEHMHAHCSSIMLSVAFKIVSEHYTTIIAGGE